MLTEYQLSKRRLGIGGSDAAAICGLSKWKTPLQVYMEKIGIEQEKKDNNFLRFGSILEPVIRQEYCNVTGENVYFDEELHMNWQFPWMIGFIDGIILDKKIIIECKTASIYTANLWGHPGTDEIPIEYLLQCAHYAIVCDASRVDIAVLMGGNDFRIYKYERNESLESKLIEAEKIFWHEHVLPNKPPDPINNEDLEKLWPISSDNEISASEDLISNCYNLSSLKNKIKKLENEKKDIEFSIKNFLKDNDTLLGLHNNKIVTWKSQQTSRLDIDALKKEMPDIYKKYLKVTENRVLRLNNKNLES